ncbi:hypothetical protein [Gordonia polyisoprenivorans]|uniref:hypothetical protein n=1 Tax=Gordonia polyisoprenivorans TaxID=84595 RepID=UPI002301E813|nr:hypothetical protein [Gordonia polyisoprenivorans]WCB36165.1 hypothetical protein PHA63_19080 [Gordonia polyisoprenivorans]
MSTFSGEPHIANLIVLAATIVTLMATAWLNWSAPAEVAVAITATRAVITRLVLETLGRIVSEQVARVIADMAFNMVVGAALNTAISSGMDLAVQGIQNLQGTRHGIDWGRVGADAESAAITGVLAGGVGAGLGRIAPNVDGVIRNYAQGVVANTAGMVGAQEITTGHVDLGSAVQAGMVFGGVDALGRSLHANTPDTVGEQPNSGLAEGELSPDLMAELHRGGASVDTAGDTAGAHPESGTTATGPENHEAGDSTAPGVQESTGEPIRAGAPWSPPLTRYPMPARVIGAPRPVHRRRARQWRRRRRRHPEVVRRRRVTPGRRGWHRERMLRRVRVLR